MSILSYCENCGDKISGNGVTDAAKSVVWTGLCLECSEDLSELENLAKENKSAKQSLLFRRVSVIIKKG